MEGISDGIRMDNIFYNNRVNDINFSSILDNGFYGDR